MSEQDAVTAKSKSSSRDTETETGTGFPDDRRRLVVTLLASLTVVALVITWLSRPADWNHIDPPTYVEVSQRIAATGGPVFRDMPLRYLPLAGIYWLTGAEGDTAGLLAVGYASAMCLVAYPAATYLYLRELIGWESALAAVVLVVLSRITPVGHPAFWAGNWQYGLAAVYAMLSLLATRRYIGDPRYLRLALVAIGVIATVGTEAFVGFAVGIIILVTLYANGQERSALILAGSAVCVALVAVVVAPQTINSQFIHWAILMTPIHDGFDLEIILRDWQSRQSPRLLLLLLIGGVLQWRSTKEDERLVWPTEVQTLWFAVLPFALFDAFTGFYFTGVVASFLATYFFLPFFALIVVNGIQNGDGYVRRIAESRRLTLLAGVSFAGILLVYLPIPG